MSDQFRKSMKTEKEKWANMNGKQRLSYYFTYYFKTTIAIVLAVIVLTSIIRTTVLNRRMENLFEGALVNTFLTVEGETYLSEDYLAHLGKGESRKVSLNTAVTISVDEEDFSQEKYYNHMKLVTLMAAEELDYMIVSKEALEILAGGDTYANLSECLPAEILEHVKDQIIFMKQEESGKEIPVAIALSDSYLAKAFSINPKECYLVFIANSKRLYLAEDFLQYIYCGLNDWK